MNDVANDFALILNDGTIFLKGNQCRVHFGSRGTNQQAKLALRDIKAKIGPAIEAFTELGLRRGKQEAGQPDFDGMQRDGFELVISRTSHGGFTLEAKLKLILAATTVTLIAATSAHADCKSDVDAIMQGMMHAGPYHMTMSSDAGGKTTNMEADVILPTSEHIKMDQMEMVILPQGSWMKRGDKWMAAPGPMGANMLNAMMSSFKDTRSNFVCGSNENFDGHSYPVYKYDSAGEAMGIKTTSHITLYKGDNGFPAGIIVDGTAMGTHSVSTQHIKYDPSITIEPPK